MVSAAPNRLVRHSISLPERIYALEIPVLQKAPGNSARLRGLGIVVSLAIAAGAIFALTHALKKVNFDEVFAIVAATDTRLIALSLALVAISYGSLTFYDLFALRTVGRLDVPYRIAALASFTSYPIAHGIGAVALISPVIRYRVYSWHGLGAVDVANICFLTGLTFWLGNLTALGLSLSYEPGAIGLMDYLPPQLNRLVAVTLLLGIMAFVVWIWISPRSFGTWRWPVRLPSGPMVLLQIVIGIFDLGAAALAMLCADPHRFGHRFLPPDHGVHCRDIAGICQPGAGGAGRIRRRDIAWTWRRRQGTVDCGAVDVPLPLSLPSVCAGARFVRRGGRVAELARQTRAVTVTPAS